MATAKKLTDNHLTCVICTEMFTDPATLQCNHTFCKSCLLKYTKTQPEAIQAKSIQCPSCRQQTKVTNPGSPVEEWVSQLKPSHVIQGLMDDFGPGTEAPETRECSVCRNQQRQTQATSWCYSCDSSFCDGCLTLHGAMPFSRDHEVGPLSDSTNFKMTAKRQFMCKHHANKKIELFCKDCKMAICTICCSINHRKCNDVDTIENVNPQVKEQLVKRTQELNIRIGNIKHGISVRKTHSDDFRNKIENAKSQIRDARAKVVELIMKKERQLLNDVDQTCTKYLHQIQTDIASKEIKLQMYQQQYEFIVNAVTSNCEMDMYALYESVDQALTDNTDKDTDNRPAPRGVVFTLNVDKVRKAVDELHLSNVKIVQDVCDRESVPTLYQTFDCTTKCNTTLKDVTVLSVDGIKIVVVVGRFEKRLLIHYTHDRHRPKYIQLSAVPYTIVQLTNWQVAVSIPNKKEIVTMKVYPHPVILSTIKTNRSYYGLAYVSPSRLVAGGIGRTDILDMEGNVLKSINTGKVSSPDYIHVTGNRNLIVGEGEAASLECVELDGQAVFTYNPTEDGALKYPQGIATTIAGEILLADLYFHKVIQLTKSGKFVRDVLTAQDGIDSPRGICLDNDGLLYVACKSSVKVFCFERH